jgi:hypothetical protein
LLFGHLRGRARDPLIEALSAAVRTIVVPNVG